MAAADSGNSDFEDELEKATREAAEVVWTLADGGDV